MISKRMITLLGVTALLAPALAMKVEQELRSVLKHRRRLPVQDKGGAKPEDKGGLVAPRDELLGSLLNPLGNQGDIDNDGGVKKNAKKDDKKEKEDDGKRKWRFVQLLTGGAIAGTISAFYIAESFNVDMPDIMGMGDNEAAYSAFIIASITLAVVFLALAVRPKNNSGAQTIGMVVTILAMGLSVSGVVCTEDMIGAAADGLRCVSLCMILIIPCILVMVMIYEKSWGTMWATISTTALLTCIIVPDMLSTVGSPLSDAHAKQFNHASIAMVWITLFVIIVALAYRIKGMGGDKRALHTFLFFGSLGGALVGVGASIAFAEAASEANPVDFFSENEVYNHWFFIAGFALVGICLLCFAVRRAYKACNGADWD